MRNQYQERSTVIRIIFLTVGIIFIVRLAFMQVFDSEYRRQADRQALRPITQFPARGLIYDRNGELLVYNEAVYDLMVIPRMTKGLDTNMFCRVMGITRDEFDARMRKACKYSTYSASPFMKQVSKEEYGSWENSLYNCGAVLSQGRIAALVPKTFLPNYSEFYEARWFASGRDLRGATVRIGGQEVPFGTDILCGDEDSGAVLGVRRDYREGRVPLAPRAAAERRMLLRLCVCVLGNRGEQHGPRIFRTCHDRPEQVDASGEHFPVRSKDRDSASGPFMHPA